MIFQEDGLADKISRNEVLAFVKTFLHVVDPHSAEAERERGGGGGGEKGRERDTEIGLVSSVWSGVWCRLGVCICVLVSVREG